MLILMVIHDYRKIHHVVFFQLDGRYHAHDVAVVPRRCGKIKNKARVKRFEHLHDKVCFSITKMLSCSLTTDGL